ncbi:MAG TPA: tail fiber domain-containing protein [Pyrinomonadaceae bacterium]|nr:tail fiber domain-containing protein [Pyrinomonadaceae bacterium]
MRTMLIAGFMLVLVTFAHGQSSEFSYQGSLTQNGNPANGNFFFEFRLFDALVAGNQIGTTVTQNNVPVSNGSFSVVLNFGPAAFPGPPRFLAVAAGVACPAPPCTVDNLSPRTPLLPTPYAYRARTVTGPVTDANPVATLVVTNSQPGISNPSSTNLPPAGLKATASGTSDVTAGAIGMSDSSGGIGLAGIANGTSPGGPGVSTPLGVLALATSTSGKSVGLNAEVTSPAGVAITARTSATGRIFEGSSENSTTGNPKIYITATGQIVTNGGVFAKGLHLTNGNFDVLESGSFNFAGGGTVGGNLDVTGTLTAGTLSLPSTLNVSSLTTTGNVTVGGTLFATTINPGQTLTVQGGSLNVGGAGNFTGTLGAPTISGNSITAGTLQTPAITTPGGFLNIGNNSVAAGDSTFTFLRTGFQSGGDVHLCMLSSGINYIRTCSSSLRYKDEVSPFSDGLQLVKRLQPISFRWIENGESSFGLGAEDVEQVDSRLVYRNEAGVVEGVRYDQVTALLINSIKQQQKMIERQQEQIDSLTRHVRRLARAQSRRSRR